MTDLPDSAMDLSGHDVRCPKCSALLGQFIRSGAHARTLVDGHTCAADLAERARREAGQPQPDLRDLIAAVLRTTPSVLMDTPEERDRHAETPRNHHVTHHYYWGCAMCRGEVDTLADAVLAVVQPERDRYRSAWQSARRRAKAWRGEYVTVAEQRADWDERYISRALYDQNVRAVHKRNERVVWQLCGEQQKAEAAEAERDRAMAGVPLICSDVRHQAKVRALEAERDSLRAVARAAAVLLRSTADRPSDPAVLRAAAAAIDELTPKET